MDVTSVTIKNTHFDYPKNLDKAISLAKNILDLRKKSTQKKEITPSGYNLFVNKESPGNSKDASHRLRLFNDVFLQGAFDHHCIGTIYRTEKADKTIKKIIEKKHNGEHIDRPTPIHCEHVIPNNLQVKYIFYRQDIVTDEKLFDFLFKNIIVCAVDGTEKDYLNDRRTIGTVTSSWARHHPEFDKKTAELLHLHTEFRDIRPFIRYKNIKTADGGELKIHCLFKKEPIDLEKYTMEDHYAILESTEELKELNRLYLEAINNGKFPL